MGEVAEIVGEPDVRPRERLPELIVVLEPDYSRPVEDLRWREIHVGCISSEDHADEVLLDPRPLDRVVNRPDRIKPPEAVLVVVAVVCGCDVAA